MKNKPDIRFKDIVYALLVNYSAKTLNSEELAPKFKARSKEERILIKKKILKELRQKADEISTVVEVKGNDINTIVKQKKQVEKIIIKILKDFDEN